MQWAPLAYLIVPRSSSAVRAFEPIKAIQRNSTHVVHLVRDVLHPCLTCLYTFDHQRKLGAYDGLRMERLLESDTLIGPSEADIDRQYLI